MKIGVLSDIHGNPYALEKVLQRAVEEGVEELIILGDFVGYYYHPDKVMAMLDNWKYCAIQGNHEEILRGLSAGELDIIEITKKYGSGHKLALEKLTATQINFLITLPFQSMRTIDEVSILLSHGSPWDKNYYLYPDSKPELLDKCELPGVDFIVTGHSHYAFCRSGKNSTLINVGSVGQSRNQSGLAQWTIINTRTKVFEMRSTPYSTEKLLREADEIDPGNEYLKHVLLRNTN